jgi:hypothetical protein
MMAAVMLPGAAPAILRRAQASGHVLAVPASVGAYQKPLSAKAVIDAPVALVIVGLGLLIVIVPSSVPGLAPPL